MRHTWTSVDGHARRAGQSLHGFGHASAANFRFLAHSWPAQNIRRRRAPAVFANSMADPGHHHGDLKVEVEKIRKEAEHEHNVKEKHHEIHHPKPAANPFPELQHQVESGKIAVVSADGRITGEACEDITKHPPQH